MYVSNYLKKAPNTSLLANTNSVWKQVRFSQIPAEKTLTVIAILVGCSLRNNKQAFQIQAQEWVGACTDWSDGKYCNWYSFSQKLLSLY